MDTTIINFSEGVFMRAGEADWDAIYAEQLPRVYNFFRYRVGDGPVAEDLTATTFEKAWRGRKRYRHNLGAFSTWLITIARNVATDHFRKNHNEISLNDARDQPAPAPLEEIVQRRHDFSHLSMLLSRLSTRERELIAYKYGAGLNNRAIAQLTRLSESNVGTILNRSVNKLRAAWEAEDER
ncbi:MAG: RNA polymerase subunit sigma-24 [Anaerolineae bacterium CG_4_9_14_0_8_um_filter_58_9]|nr:MAG: RNA polymerase subunit sigma-24 [Anaerolineae bacterium CG_4_9_14_0_8_um_filter_58_9]